MIDYTRSHILEQTERKWVIDFAVKLWRDATKTGTKLGVFKNAYEQQNGKNIFEKMLSN